MATNVLLLLPPAAQFAAELRPEFPDVNFIEAPVEKAVVKKLPKKEKKAA